MIWFISQFDSVAHNACIWNPIILASVLMNYLTEIFKGNQMKRSNRGIILIFFSEIIAKAFMRNFSYPLVKPSTKRQKLRAHGEKCF